MNFENKIFSMVIAVAIGMTASLVSASPTIAVEKQISTENLELVQNTTEKTAAEKREMRRLEREKRRKERQKNRNKDRGPFLGSFS